MTTINNKIFIKQYLKSGLISGCMLLIIHFTKSDYAMCLPIAIPIIAAILGAAGGAASASGGSGGSAGKLGSAKNTMNRLGQFAESDPMYESSPYAGNNLGLAQTLLNSRMAGAQSRENNIATSGANTRASVGRNATDSSQALAAMVGSQGAQDQSYNDLALQEGQDAQMKQQNLINANQGMVAEGDKLHDDATRRWQDQVNIAMTQYKIRTKKRQDTARAIGGFLTGAGAGLSSIGGAGGGG